MVSYRAFPLDDLNVGFPRFLRFDLVKISEYFHVFHVFGVKAEICILFSKQQTTKENVGAVRAVRFGPRVVRLVHVLYVFYDFHVC